MSSQLQWLLLFTCFQLLCKIFPRCSCICSNSWILSKATWILLVNFFLTKLSFGLLCRQLCTDCYTAVACLPGSHSFQHIKRLHHTGGTFLVTICHCHRLSLKTRFGSEDVVIHRQEAVTRPAPVVQARWGDVTPERLWWQSQDGIPQPPPVRASRLGLPFTRWGVFSEAAQRHYSLRFLEKNQEKSQPKAVMNTSLTGLPQWHVKVWPWPLMVLVFVCLVVFLAMSYPPSACYSFPTKNLTFTNHQVNDSSLLHLWIRL